MHLVGYADPLVIGPGQSVDFHVSTDLPAYRVEIVRLWHGDRNPAGPGFKEQIVKGLPPIAALAENQPIVRGSCAVIDDAVDAFATDWSIGLWLWPTLPEKEGQTLISCGGPGGGWSLTLGKGRLAVGPWSGKTVELGRGLHAREWYHLTLGYSIVERRLSWTLSPRRFLGSATPMTGAVAVDLPTPDRGDPLVFAADARQPPAAAFNGKIADPVLLGTALPLEAHGRVADGVLDADPLVVARWDLAANSGGRTMVNPADPRWNGRLIGRPTRAMTGPHWTGNDHDFRSVPEQYGAIHFHDDDLEDAGWKPSFRVDLPPTLPSGIYAAKLIAEGRQEYVSFFVTPAEGAKRARIAMHVPTFSYMAYGNESLDANLLPPGAFPLAAPQADKERFDYLSRHELRSTYDHHNDGSGICFASALRPNLTSLAPDHRCRLFNGPHQLSADLHLVDWLREKGFEVDIVTDHCIHALGSAALASYALVLSGTHPEYHSEATLDGIEAYMGGGGSYMYLGGNGYYWIVAIEPERRMLLEIRRPHGTRAWSGDPGEGRLSLSGEIGGLWALRGRPPQKLFGVGMAAQGFDRGTHYVRSAASFDEPFARLFEGVEGAIFGDMPALVMSHGAAGYEVDRADPSLGTPPHAVVLASSAPFSDNYQHVVEEVHATSRFEGGSTCPDVRSDVVILKTAAGGTIFSTGSISWCSTLSHNRYDNDVSTITANVIEAILDDS